MREGPGGEPADVRGHTASPMLPWPFQETPSPHELEEVCSVEPQRLYTPVLLLKISAQHQQALLGCLQGQHPVPPATIHIITCHQAELECFTTRHVLAAYASHQLFTNPEQSSHQSYYAVDVDILYDLQLLPVPSQTRTGPQPITGNSTLHAVLACSKADDLATHEGLAGALS